MFEYKLQTGGWLYVAQQYHLLDHTASFSTEQVTAIHLGYYRVNLSVLHPHELWIDR